MILGWSGTIAETIKITPYPVELSIFSGVDYVTFSKISTHMTWAMKSSKSIVIHTPGGF